MQKRQILLIIMGSALVLFVFFIGALAIINKHSSTPATLPTPTPEAVTEEDTLTPEAELALQEQIAPLIQAGDMTACEQVQDEMYKKVCINNIALNKASETSDISYCQYIDNELIPRADCEHQVVSTLSLEKEEQAICDQATDETVKTQCKETYHLALALKKNDATLCAQATNPAQCTDSFSLQQFMQDPSQVACTTFSTPEAQADCTALKAAATDQQAFLQFCQEKQSELFTPLCMMMGMQQGLPPGLPAQP